MKICIITAETPFSNKESFILEEIRALNEIADVLVAPRDVKGKQILNSENLNVLALPLFNVKIFAGFLGQLFTKEMAQILRVIFQAKNKRTIPKNLAVLPKSVTLAQQLKSREISHIHAHWGGTTSSMALFVHIFSQIPFSVTFHRWDITENNLLVEKTAAAKFIRTISKSGFSEVTKMIPANLAKKVFVLHMGVTVTTKMILNKRNNILKIVNVGNLVPEKGQETFLQALKVLKDKNVKFKADIFGDGPLKNHLISLAEKLDLNITFHGHVEHSMLLNKYSQGEYDLMVMTSLIEGIPVALMEAMAYRIPVITTDAGGISELIEDKKTGFLAYDRSPESIARTIISVLEQSRQNKMIAENAKKRIDKYFNVRVVAKKLLNKLG